MSSLLCIECGGELGSKGLTARKILTLKGKEYVCTTCWPIVHKRVQKQLLEQATSSKEEQGAESE